MISPGCIQRATPAHESQVVGSSSTTTKLPKTCAAAEKGVRQAAAGSIRWPSWRPPGPAAQATRRGVHRHLVCPYLQIGPPPVPCATLEATPSSWL